MANPRPEVKRELLRYMDENDVTITTHNGLDAALRCVRPRLSVKGLRWVDNAKYGVKMKLLLELRKDR